jgi:hypothetical protein
LWADDAVALAEDQRNMVAIPLPFRTKLRAQSSELLAESSDQYFRRHTRAHRLSAVCILQRDHEPRNAPVMIRRLNAGEAFRELIAHAYWFVLPGVDSKRRMVQLYLKTAAQTEIYEVRFRPDLSRLPDLVETIAAQILGKAAPALPVSQLHSVRAVDAP